MVEGMKVATKQLREMNRGSNLPAMGQLAMEFEKESALMEQREEMTNDALDETFGPEETETDDIVERVLEEIGVETKYSVSIMAAGCAIYCY